MTVAKRCDPYGIGQFHRSFVEIGLYYCQHCCYSWMGRSDRPLPLILFGRSLIRRCGVAFEKLPNQSGAYLLEPLQRSLTT
jgi:hypothetical protein